MTSLTCHALAAGKSSLSIRTLTLLTYKVSDGVWRLVHSKILSLCNIFAVILGAVAHVAISIRGEHFSEGPNGSFSSSFHGTQCSWAE